MWRKDLIRLLYASGLFALMEAGINSRPLLWQSFENVEGRHWEEYGFHQLLRITLSPAALDHILVLVSGLLLFTGGLLMLAVAVWGLLRLYAKFLLTLSILGFILVVGSLILLDRLVVEAYGSTGFNELLSHGPSIGALLVVGVSITQILISLWARHSHVRKELT